MKRMRLPVLFIGLFLLVVRASGQPRDNDGSHVPVPLPRGVDLQKLLAERLPQSLPWGSPQDLSKLQSDLNNMLKQIRSGDPRAKVDTRLQLQQLLQNNPQLLEQLREFERNYPDMFRSVVDGVVRQNPELSGKVNPEELRERLQQLTRPPDGDRRPNGPRSVESPPRRAAPPRRTRPPATKSADEDAAVEQNRETIARNLSKLADRFDKNRLAPSLRESPAVNHLLERLANSGMEALRSGSAGEGLDAQLARWQRRFEGMRDWVPDRLPEKILDYVPPTMADLPRPNFRIPRFDFRAPRIGGLRPSSGMLDGVQFILFALLLLAVAVVVWRILATRGARSFGLKRGLGPWPLDPSRVSNRAELIRAFEYLSLLRCGEKARSWHHRAIAAGLGGTEAARRAAAERLAELYEHARYAPQAETLPDRAFVDARRHLTDLAGAGRA
jgi:hypothetical protein